jgi:TRAP-type C4-dicarboxylate transport system substrate-binding protein
MAVAVLAGLAMMAVMMVTMVMAPCALAQGKKKPFPSAWKPAFDYAGAKYKIKVSNVSHPDIKGVFAGFAMRDALWKATGGQIYLEYLPLSLLGGEVEVLNQLQMGAIQGMGVSSVAAPNMGPRMGVVHLPYLVNDYEKLERFCDNEKLFSHFLDGMRHQGLMGVDVTAYGQYGWATTVPVTTVAEARKVKIRIAEAPVNKAVYKAWGFNPVVMPWPEVPFALKRGVIEGLDHTQLVCYIDKKFDVAKHFTTLNYAQGLFIWVFNERWFKSLPPDLQKTFLAVVKKTSADYRAMTQDQAAETRRLASEQDGVTFHDLSPEDYQLLQQEGKVVHEEFAKTIGPDYLKEVQTFLGYGR